MRPRWIAIFYAIVISTSLVTPNPVPLIVDTDIGGGACKDVDDVAAISVAHALTTLGEANLLAIVVNTKPAEGVGVVSVLNEWYGRSDLPIGAYKGDAISDVSGQLPYVEELVTGWPSKVKNSSQVSDATIIYRRALASQADRSVAIASIGLMTNLEALLRSQGDEISPLDGVELVRQKVRLLVAMAGTYPKSATLLPECNMCGCYNAATPQDILAASSASEYVFSRMPSEVRVIFSGSEVGLRVQSGGRLSSCQPVSCPSRAAFENFGGGPNRSRFSWDPLSTLVAVRGPEGAYTALCDDCAGHNVVNGTTGSNVWDNGKSTNQTYLVLRDAVKAGEALDNLLCRDP